MDLGPALRQTHIGLLHQLTKIETAELHTHTKQDAPSFQKIIGSLADTQNLGNPKCAFLRFQPNGCFLSHGCLQWMATMDGLQMDGFLSHGSQNGCDSPLINHLEVS
jgi:hypothetical protein